ncbi:MAG: hypothetical protein J6T76_07145 [Paludibacteraceae bacterium]|jgi:Mn-dependent transcriptional regulator|nr:hypothetical protein [Paludibacteraceae bacterium]MBO7456156.1 hypothetical protein [Paludibacteraceae bacterium]
MAKSFYFSIQSWMLEEMDLSLTDVAVFAYINGLTNSEELGKQGWHGSGRRLATVLHVSPSTMNSILNRLKKRGFIRFHNGYIISNLHRELPPKKASVQNLDSLAPAEGDKVPK